MPKEENNRIKLVRRRNFLEKEVVGLVFLRKYVTKFPRFICFLTGKL